MFINYKEFYPVRLASRLFITSCLLVGCGTAVPKASEQNVFECLSKPVIESFDSLNWSMEQFKSKLFLGDYLITASMYGNYHDANGIVVRTVEGERVSADTFHEVQGKGGLGQVYFNGCIVTNEGVYNLHFHAHTH